MNTNDCKQFCLHMTHNGDHRFLTTFSPKAKHPSGKVDNEAIGLLRLQQCFICLTRHLSIWFIRRPLCYHIKSEWFLSCHQVENNSSAWQDGIHYKWWCHKQGLWPHRWEGRDSCCKVSLGTRSGLPHLRCTTPALYGCSCQVGALGHRHSLSPSAGHHEHLQNICDFRLIQT